MSIDARRYTKGEVSGVALNELNIGVAEESYCDMGGRPSMSSIVLTMLLVE